MIRRLIARIYSKRVSKKSKINIEKAILAKDKIRNGYNNEVSKKEQSKFDIVEFKNKHRHVETALKAWMSDSNTILFIAVLPEGPTAKIYYFTKRNPDQPIHTDVKGNTITNVIGKKWDQLKKKGLNVGETEVEDIGKDFHRHLLQNKLKLPNKYDRMSGVWVYCEYEDIDPLWEWIYWEEKKSFWGDIFHIVRIEGHCDISDCQVSSELIILKDRTPNPLWDSLTSDCNGRVVKCRGEYLHNDSFRPGCIKNCIVCCPIAISGTINVALEKTFNNKNKILLLYPCTKLSGLKVLPSAWIDSRLDIPKEHAKYFVNCFCEVLNDLKKPREVRVAEIVTETRKKMERDPRGSNFNKLWRLAYVVNGNPYTTLTAY